MTRYDISRYGRQGGFSVTYEIVTPESAEDGDVAESGLLAHGVTLAEAISEMGGLPLDLAASSSYAHPRVWFEERDGDTDFRTGAETRRALHLPEGITEASRRRIARLVGARLRPWPPAHP